MHFEGLGLRTIHFFTEMWNISVQAETEGGQHEATGKNTYLPLGFHYIMHGPVPKRGLALETRPVRLE